MKKRVGSFEIQVFDDCSGVKLTYHHNDSVSEDVSFRGRNDGMNDLLDLQYAVSCAIRALTERLK